MAELLVKAEQTGAGPGAYLPGHIKDIQPNGFVWGAKEGPPQFYLLQVPDEFVEENEELTIAEVDGSGELLARRRWTLDLGALPPGIQQAMQTGKVNLPLAVIEAVLKLEDRTPAARPPDDRGRRG